MKNTMSVREKRKDGKQGMNEMEEGEEKEGWRGRWEEGEGACEDAPSRGRERGQYEPWAVSLADSRVIVESRGG